MFKNMSGNVLGGNFPGENSPGGSFPGRNFPDTFKTIRNISKEFVLTSKATAFQQVFNDPLSVFHFNSLGDS